MSRLAWITHRDVIGGEGGAEASDRDMLNTRPVDTEVTLIGPGGITGDLSEFDHIVATGLWGFSARELNELARTKFSFWVHDMQLSGHWIYESASTLVLLTPQHQEWEVAINPLIRKHKIHLNPGYFPTEYFIDSVDKEPVALWAHRPEAHKGLDLAEEWARDKGIPLNVMTGRPRHEVLAAMMKSQYFVLLSHIRDPGPRSIMEAQLSGCEIIVNENVGYWPADSVRNTVSTAPERFWERVLND